MKCHYEILGISKNADDSEIKSAYRKLALKWHPDKNLGNSEHAKEQFQLVQQAYEILSDKQERAWYDSHREQILGGADSEFKDKSLDVFQYFTTTCFRGYNDQEKGFYTIYRNVFDQIAKEDIDFMDEKEEFCEIPSFGNLQSDYEAVSQFYNYWMSYSTKKSYAWLDPYDIREGKGDRRILKLIEKENKKARQKARKERNDEIRNLVAFVRKRDKRMQEFTKQMEAKTLENRKKQEIFSKQKRLELKKMHQNEKQAEWAKFDNFKSELEEIEKHLAQEFGEEESNSEGEEEEIDCSNLYCVACNKVFKNPKAFENHESSKKHKENIEKLKETMREEEESLVSDNLEEYKDLEGGDVDNIADSSDDEVSGSESLASEEINCEVEENVETKEVASSKKNKKKNKKLKSILQTIDYSRDEVNEIEDSDKEDLQEEVVSSKKNKKKNKKTKSVLSVNVSDENNQETTKLEDSDNDFDFGSSSKKQKKKKKTPNKNKSEPNDKNETENNSIPTVTVVKTKKEKKVKKEVTLADLNEVDVSHCCVTCKADFPSKNKLFDHLKKTNHGVYIPKMKASRKNIKEK